MDIHPELALNLNSPKPLASIAIITMSCCCANKTVIMTQMGLPAQCPSCKKVWLVQATIKIQIQEVLADLSKQLASSLS